MISLPKEWKTYYNSIKDRCRDLIEYNIWGGIDVNQFDLWRKNFVTDEEKYFASRVLDSLIYKSNQQTYSLIYQILNRNLNNLFRIEGKSNLQDFPQCLMQHNVDPLVRLVPVITSHDPVTKSSNEILRFFKRHFLISEQWIINPWNIKDHVTKGVEAFIFIDDFLGTGTQFDDVIIDCNLSSYIDKGLVVYAPLVAHQKGIDKLMNDYPNLKITHAEKFGDNHSFFNNYFSGEPEVAKEFYKNMLTQRGISLHEGNEYGYGNLELTLAFEHAAPDNSLQILTYRTDTWAPLFNR